jgi:WD40 repeat protein
VWEHEYDLFVVFAADDADFVRGYLLPALGLAPSRTLLVDALPLGGSIVAEIERGVTRSRFTVAVLSLAYLADRWAVFGELLASHLAVDASRIVPLRLASCQLPLRLDARVALDFTHPSGWELEITRLRDLLQSPVPPPEPLPCPYPGMRPFATGERARFFGRSREIAELVGRLKAGEHEIYVIGPSGSGKSSLISAGVIPELQRTPQRFAIRTFRPGEHPTQRLAEVRDWTPTSTEQRLLLYLDQFEEVFTLASADERRAFVAGLREVRADPRCHVIVSLRVEFYGAIMSSELWPDIEGRFTRLEVAPLRGAALRESIEAPAASVGAYIERALVDRLIADAATEPGALPLLQEALVLLWAGLQHRLLRLADYEKLGGDGRSGLAVALAMRADATLHDLTRTEQAIARRILLRLISFGEGRPDTRRQQARAALSTSEDDAPAVDRTIRRLVDARMLTVNATDRGEPLIDLAHEALISGWPELKSWLASRRDDEQRRRRLEQRAAAWALRGRGSVGLFDAVELAEAERWSGSEAARELGHSDDLARFLRASRGALDAQDRERRRLRRRLTWSAVALLSLITLAGVGLGVAGWRARAQARHALGLGEEEQARGLLADNHDPLRAVPHLAKAIELGVDRPQLRTMLADLRRWAGWRLVVQHGAKVKQVAVSPDSARMLTVGDDQRVRIWDIATGKAVGGALDAHDGLLSANFTSDGSQIVTTTDHGIAGWWDAATGQATRAPFDVKEDKASVSVSPDGTQIVSHNIETGIARIFDPATGAARSAAMDHGRLLLHVAFSPDLKRIATSGADGVARLWDASTGAPLGPVMTHGPAGVSTLVSAAFSPDGSRLVTASFGDALVWDVATATRLYPPMTSNGVIYSVAFSTDGTRLVIAARSQVTVWDMAKGEAAFVVENGTIVLEAAFSPDGTSLLTRADDGVVRLWDARSGKPIRAIKHESSINSAIYTPDGAYVITGADDGTARVWDVMPPSGTQLRHASDVSSAKFSPDGTRVLTASADGTAMLWNATTSDPIGVPLHHERTVLRAVFSPDGQRVVTASLDRTARVWDATTGRAISGPFVHDDELRVEEDIRPVSRREPQDPAAELVKGAVLEAAFSPDGRFVVTASADGTARIWDVATGRETHKLIHDTIVVGARFSPDGKRVVTTTDYRIYFWDAATGEVIGKPLAHDHEVASVAFSPDGSRMVSASADKTARIWNAATGAPVGITLVHDKAVNSAMFDPTGTRVVTASADSTARIWDATTGAPLVTLAHPEPVNLAVFSPDGTRVVTACHDGAARIWDAETGKPLGEPLYHGAPIEDVSFNPDGTRLVTASDDGTAQIWRVIETGSLASWLADVEICAAPEARAMGVSRTCPLANREVPRSRRFARVRATIAAGDARLYSRRWALPRADYERALALLSVHDDQPPRADLDEAGRLRKAIAFRIAILDARDGHLDGARTLLAADKPMLDAMVFENLAEIAHDTLSNDDVALELLSRARDLDPHNVAILCDLAEAQFTSRQRDEVLARTLHEIAGLKPPPYLQLAMATIAWASAYARGSNDDAARAQLLAAYGQMEHDKPSAWSWPGTKHALAYGRFTSNAGRTIRDVIELLEQPVSDKAAASLAQLLKSNAHH